MAKELVEHRAQRFETERLARLASYARSWHFAEGHRVLAFDAGKFTREVGR